jgi:NAD(P)-dependent dehydrogenase (short-subunit alcohol dehydrogenase family)
VTKTQATLYGLPCCHPARRLDHGPRGLGICRFWLSGRHRSDIDDSYAPLEEYPLEAFDKLRNVNVKALFNITIRCLRRLCAAASARDPARVINVGSIDGLRVSVIGELRLRRDQGRDAHAYPAARHPAGQGVDQRQRARPGPFRQHDGNR